MLKEDLVSLFRRVCPVQHMHLFVLIAPNWKTLENAALQIYTAMMEQVTKKSNIQALFVLFNEIRTPQPWWPPFDKGSRNKPF